MSTYVVWMLLVFSFSPGTKLATIDNISSQANCEALKGVVDAQIKANGFASVGDSIHTQCVAVRKVKP